MGEGQEKIFEVLKYAPDFLPSEKPRYLMGVGNPDDIVGAVKNGIDDGLHSTVQIRKDWPNIYP